MSPQTFVLATTAIGAVAVVLEVGLAALVDDAVGDDELDPQAASIKALAANAAAPIRGRKRVLKKTSRANDNGNRFQ
jgi:hypothetical protein